MGRHDWYRLTTWTEEDKAAFFRRLNRSRSLFNKAQYARIQALYLEQSGDDELVKAALSLLEQLIQEWPDPFSLADAYKQMARCHLKFGNEDEALNCYKRALEAEAAYPTVKTGAAFEYCWFIVRKERRELYPAALEVLTKYIDVLIFPHHEFIYYSVLAIVLADSCQVDDASEAAKKALMAAAKTESGFTYHKKEGLVGPQDDVFLQKLWRIAEKTTLQHLDTEKY